VSVSVNATPPVANVTCYAGDDVSFTLTALEDGVARPLDGTHLAQVRLKRTSAAPAFAITVAVVDAPEGICSFEIAGSDLTTFLGSALKVEGVWDWQHTNVDGTKTYAQGRFIVKADVSRA
jgi:hypothetical protein